MYTRNPACSSCSHWLSHMYSPSSKPLPKTCTIYSFALLYGFTTYICVPKQCVILFYFFYFYFYESGITLNIVFRDCFFHSAFWDAALLMYLRGCGSFFSWLQCSMVWVHPFSCWDICIAPNHFTIANNEAMDVFFTNLLVHMCLTFFREYNLQVGFQDLSNSKCFYRFILSSTLYEVSTVPHPFQHFVLLSSF